MNTTIKQMTNQEYLDKNAAQCPRCGSDNISGNALEVNDSALDCIRPVSCDDCGAAWSEVFQMIGIEHVTLSVPAANDK